MKFFVNENCIGCGACAATCPEFFHLNSANVAECADKDVPPALESSALDAQSGCPMGAIETK